MCTSCYADSKQMVPEIAMSENGTYKRPIIINLFSSKTSSVPESESQQTKSLCNESQFNQPNFVTTDYISDDLNEFNNSPICKATLSSDDSDKDYELDNIIQGYGKLPKNTNLCFSFDALSAINQDWVSLVKFLKDQNDSILHTKTRKTGAKILLLITRSQFLWKLALVMDILNCLSDFSNQAQDSNGLPFTFHNELQNACCDIQKAAEGKGATVQTFIGEMCTMPPSFRGTSIHIDINLNKVISGSLSLASLLVDFLNKQTFDKTFFDNYHIFDTRKWPQHEQDLTLFGNSEYLKLHLSLGRSEEELFALSEWWSFKKYVYQNFSSELLAKPKIVFLKVIDEFCSKISVVFDILIKLLFLDFSCNQIEKGYREMNLIKSSDRCMLSVASLQHSMMITMHGPLFAQFNPFPVIELWMKDCSRRYHKRSKQKNKNMILTDCDSFLESFNKSSHMNPL
ncbi:zinc finger protein [Trichonephila inaurata madagascariensis]|uniref:Zinc finger protein n=1 Tax=Trichonephila inaurata madagascariensis TaxID=2747483 RepID=A0A8X6WUT6_9ARAC|nr:zinc finger protein [Trichonephila inaurata madagascariensis]